jgi:hypothetical protein
LAASLDPLPEGVGDATRRRARSEQPGLHHDRAQGKCECSSYARSGRSARPAEPAEFRRYAWLGVLPQRSILGCRPFCEDPVRKDPGNSTYRYHLRFTDQKLNDLARARTEFEKTISLDAKSLLANEAPRVLSQTTGTWRISQCVPGESLI